MSKRHIILLAATGAAFAGGSAPAGAADVCNEAERSHRGGYTVSGDPVDPNPPARLLGSQMRVGNGKGKGLVHASIVSPALRTCGPTPPPATGGGITGGSTSTGGTTGGSTSTGGTTTGGTTGGDTSTGGTTGGDTSTGGTTGGDTSTGGTTEAPPCLDPWGLPCSDEPMDT